ncbi:MAG: DUF1559 domain-containing protein, partial [Pirellulales bacterium]|nr:DUF1559 domain-containing protein [Pirellulales bacterium]
VGTSAGWGGDVFCDGLFAMNRSLRCRDVTDGTSTTFAFGESVHVAYRGYGAGYSTPEGGPVPWYYGGECGLPCTAQSTNRKEYGRGYRSTKYPLNSSLLPMSIDIENEAPFGSYHSGGAHFVFADGHVVFINDTIDMTVYQSLSTTADGEVISGNAY